LEKTMSAFNILPNESASPAPTGPLADQETQQAASLHPGSAPAHQPVREVIPWISASLPPKRSRISFGGNRNKRLRGVAAELRFAAAVIERGLVALHPYGDSERY